jgi:hypothetical protein
MIILFETNNGGCTYHQQFYRYVSISNSDLQHHLANDLERLFY